MSKIKLRPEINQNPRFPYISDFKIVLRLNSPIVWRIMGLCQTEQKKLCGNILLAACGEIDNTN